jgi:hypothetical protein
MDMELLLVKKSGGILALLEKDFELMHQGSICSIISFYNWKYVELLINQNQYEIRSEGKSRWLLDQQGANIACCKKHTSGSSLEFEIEFDDRVWCFKPNRKKLVLGHDIWEGKLKIGRVTPRIGLWRWSEITATFTQVQRLEIASFAIWIIGIHWVGTSGKVTATRAQIGI